MRVSLEQVRQAALDRESLLMNELLKGLARLVAGELSKSGFTFSAELDCERVLREAGLGELLEAGQNAVDYTYHRGETSYYKWPWDKALSRVRAAVAGAEKGSK